MGNLAKLRNFPDLLPVPVHLFQLFPNGSLHKQALGILGQHAHATMEQFSCFVLFDILAEDLHRSPVGLADTGDGFQRGGFAGAVSTHNGKNTSLGYRQIHTLKYIGTILLIAEPNFLRL